MAEQHRPTILVTDAGRGSAVAIIRSLGRKGWRVIAADSDPRSLGFRSRYASERLLYPPPDTTPRDLVNALAGAVRDRKIDLIIPVTDAIILPLSAERARFDGLCKLALPDADALELVTNKHKTFELAQRLGVPTPRTVLVQTAAEADDQVQALQWPVVLKPQASRLYREYVAIEAYTVSYAENRDQLATQMRRFEGRCPVLLQEYCPGAGHGVELLLYHGQPLAAFQHKRLREVPLTGGASSFRESVPLDPELYEYSVRLLKELKWTGLAMVEFKVGARGVNLMEINGRVWGSLPLAVLSGMDFPARLAELYLFGPPDPVAVPDSHYTVGVRARNLELDILWIASVLRGKRRYPFLAIPGRDKAIAALVGMLNPANKFDILSLKDPRPGLAELRKIARKLNTKMTEAA